MNHQSLALREDQVPSAEAMAQMLSVAKALVDAGMVPQGIKTPGQALALILTGREMRIGPLRSVQDLYHVKGNVGMQTKFMVAQFRLAGHYHDILVQTDEHCKVMLHLKDGREVVVELTRAEANALGYPYFWDKEGQRRLKPHWSTDPAGMLYNRTMTEGIRTHTPEVLYGMLTEEEIGDGAVSAGESRLVAFLKQQHPDVWSEWAESQVSEQPAQAQTPQQKSEQGEVINGESRELPSVGDNGDKKPLAELRPQTHWIDNVDTAGRQLRAVFWEWALVTIGLQTGEVFEALGTKVEQEFPSMEKTKSLIQAYIDRQAGERAEAFTQAPLLEQDIPFDG